jgi:nicotinate-nucleotide adenylyltransferase
MIEDIIDGFAGKNLVMKKKIALYFGSFNPIHIGHLIIANHIAGLSGLDEVWFVVSPQNPHKEKKNLLEDIHRLALVRCAVEDNPNFKVSDIEFGLPKPSYTVYTLQALKEKYPQYKFSLIMGEDNLRTLHKWKNYERILENHEVIVYPRLETIQEKKSGNRVAVKNEVLDHANITMTNAPIMNISSSLIRAKIKEGKDVKYLLSDPVYKYLDEMNFYK